MNKNTKKIMIEEIKRINTAKIGKHAMLTIDAFTIEVELKDYKMVFGRDCWLVSPINENDTGEKWVSKITFIY